jgi:uncharacterized protein YbjQ (UPF0145 family)
MAGDRAARPGGVFTSFLSVPSALAVGAAGLVPVGEVVGTTVVWLSWAGWPGCGVSGTDPVTRGQILPGFADYTDALAGGYRTALDRMTAEAESLGADGILGVRLHGANFFGVPDLVRFTARGTAVRRGPKREVEPFCTLLDGGEVLALLGAGWQPTSVHVEVAVLVRHDDWATRRQAGSFANAEVGAYTAMLRAGRTQLRDQLVADAAAAGDDGVLVAELSDRSWMTAGNEEGHRDLMVEFFAVGNGIARLDEPASGRGVGSVLPLR